MTAPSVHADIPEVDAVVLDGYDGKANVLGAKGLGELGICGAGATVANAVFNATGVRMRDFPITLDKVLPALPALILESGTSLHRAPSSGQCRRRKPGNRPGCLTRRPSDGSARLISTLRLIQRS